jgi:hypothetical protein
MNHKIVTTILMVLAGAFLVGISYVVFVPVPDAIGAGGSKEAERLRAAVTCIEQSGASKDRDYRVAGYKATRCVPPAAEGPEQRLAPTIRNRRYRRPQDQDAGVPPQARGGADTSAIGTGPGRSFADDC